MAKIGNGGDRMSSAALALGALQTGLVSLFLPAGLVCLFLLVLAGCGGVPCPPGTMESEDGTICFVPDAGTADAQLDGAADSSGPLDSGPVDGAMDSAMPDGSADSGGTCDCAWRCGSDGCEDPLDVAAGGGHTCALVGGGRLYCWGENLSNQLGGAPGTSGTALVPLANVRGVEVGGKHSCAIVGEGELYCWGADQYGQVGRGGTVRGSVPSPTRVMEGDVTRVATGAFHTCAINAGSLYCWGANNGGQLGFGSEQDVVPTPRHVPGLTDVTEVAVGELHTCAISGGGLYCWGVDAYGQVGRGGSVRDNVLSPVRAVGLENVSAVATGAFHSCAIDRGALYCWGRDTYGQVGRGGPVRDNVLAPIPIVGLSNPTAIAAGAVHTCALTGGALRCWGRDEYGQVGRGGTTRDDVPAPAEVAALTGVTQVSAGSKHTIAIAGFQPWSWGDNVFQQIGDGTIQARPQPVLATAVPR